jgi:hypothetical protein
MGLSKDAGAVAAGALVGVFAFFFGRKAVEGRRLRRLAGDGASPPVSALRPTQKKIMELSPKRAAVMAFLDEVIPSQYPDAKFKRIAPSYDPDHLPMPNYTPCGELAARAGAVAGINTRGGLSSIRDIGRANGSWVEAGGGRRPNPGDLYLLGNAQGAVLHTGVIKDANGDVWITGDSGQGDAKHSAALFLSRPYDEVAVTLGGPAGPRKLLGWYDIDPSSSDLVS